MFQATDFDNQNGSGWKNPRDIQPAADRATDFHGSVEAPTPWHTAVQRHPNGMENEEHMSILACATVKVIEYAGSR